MIDSFDIVFPILVTIGMVLWIYCIWFLNKYDKNTNRLLLLLFLNIYYVPFYLFRIRRIKKEIRIRDISEEVYDADFIKLTRSSIIETLKLWASNDNQKVLDEMELNTNSAQELFEEWNNVYNIDNRLLEETFNESERELLNSFNRTIMISNEKIKDCYPDLSDFKTTNDWRVLNQLAVRIIRDLE